ncbi:uncharacterized protein LOC119672194 [Teleopsis dalmanni]|uniref:uncharacterized protein LOC119668490 n=1 Tax=Teleopsis dalmanni TaxID=139649 RepID=UPI0018CD01DE|nr:uncharacterized protein LOC119668490 [Teleopsis dalmanni]XP_037933944.1 uncharacterized protein LOC119668490 [Teleopsis dalmanni]XP_037939115.1 uncharacterized protein LOC119672194 [Teleopsis dalmanni]XP_037939116.1 uncharacterized protein LOC119672194 [Teleopsis dalmanni]
MSLIFVSRPVCQTLSKAWDTSNFEKPTAQIYYKKLLEVTKIDTTWDLVRFKMRYFKQSFVKANNWRKSTGAGLLDDEEVTSIKDKVKLMCPYYDQLSEIFGEKAWSNKIVLQSSAMVCDKEMSV